MFFNKDFKKKSISERSADVLSSFNETITTLEELNTEIETVVVSNNETINKLQVENAELATVASKNANVIVNIKRLMGL